MTADKPLELSYAVALWDGEAGKTAVEKLYRRWLQLSPDQTTPRRPCHESETDDLVEARQPP